MEQHLLQWEVDDAALQMNDRFWGSIVFHAFAIYFIVWNRNGILDNDPICGVPLGGLALLGRYLASRNRYTTALRNVSWVSYLTITNKTIAFMFNAIPCGNTKRHGATQDSTLWMPHLLR